MKQHTTCLDVIMNNQLQHTPDEPDNTIKSTENV